MMSFRNLNFRCYQGVLAALISVGLLAAILVVNGPAQEGVLGIDSLGAPSCKRTESQNCSATMLKVEKAVHHQEASDGSVRPWVLLASRGMRHDHGEHEYGERVSPTFSRIVQSKRFVPILVLVGLFAVILLAYRLWWYKPLVPVIVVARREIQGMVKSLGTVQSQEAMTVRSQRSGTIEKLHVAQGDKVTKGQILAELIPSTSKNEGTARQGDILQLVASADGVITACNLAVADEVYPGTPIFQMVEAGQIWVATRTSETRGAQVRVGQKAVIKLGSGREFEGEVMRIKKDPDPAARQYELLVQFRDLPDPAVIGEEALAIIATGHQTAPVVPITAVTFRNDQHEVLVVDDGLVYFRPISLGVQNGKWAAVLEGVKEGELVIVAPKTVKPEKEVRAEVMTSTFMEE